MFKKIILIKKAYINMENKALCLFITFFVIINIFFILFLYTSCRGIACNDQGRFAIGMDSRFFGSDTIFFYDENGGLIKSVDINNYGRSQAEMYYSSEYVCYRTFGDVHYFDYNGTELNDIVQPENIYEEFPKCVYTIENNMLSVAHKKHLGLEYIIYNRNKTRIHIYFKTFFRKILWLLLTSPFIVYVIKKLKKSMLEIDQENIT